MSSILHVLYYVDITVLSCVTKLVVLWIEMRQRRLDAVNEGVVYN